MRPTLTLGSISTNAFGPRLPFRPAPVGKPRKDSSFLYRLPSLLPKEQQCHGWFLWIVRAFAALYATEGHAEPAKAFAVSRRLDIKRSFWRKERRDDVILRLIDEFEASRIIAGG